MIPQFPQFKKLVVEDHEAVDAHTRGLQSYSDYNFTSMWAWNIEERRELSMLNDNLVVKFTDYVTGEPFLSFLGKRETQRTACSLLDFSESMGLPPESLW
ncbi:MAG: hypothetical protein RL701_5542 [Pseudomonadota bacterium]|jgi:hypothetical protein